MSSVLALLRFTLSDNRDGVSYRVFARGDVYNI